MAKVIAKTSDRVYLIEVNHIEMEKYMGLYYGNMSVLDVGQELDFGAGYDHAKDIKEAFEKTQAFIEANAKTINAINNGLTVLKNIPKTAIARQKKG